MALPRSSDAARLAGSPSGCEAARVPPFGRPCRQKEAQTGSRSQTLGPAGSRARSSKRACTSRRVTSWSSRGPVCAKGSV
eukprot:11157486-Lingulodinium_polyedra.AAC.1